MTLLVMHASNGNSKPCIANHFSRYAGRDGELQLMGAFSHLDSSRSMCNAQLHDVLHSSELPDNLFAHLYLLAHNRASRVRVQNAQKVEIGIMSLDEARELALNSGRADVVLINEGGDPPVVRLMQFSKYKFELERAAKQKQKASKGTEIKEVKLRPVTEPHDFEVKLKAVKGFLSKGSKVKLTMQFSGREMRFKDQGKAMMLKLIEDLSTISKQESPLSLRASTFSVTLAAVK
eukprot:GHRR01023043.1.p1 GENE.GHRR01023043.1~~GHRR01023043.1.p1  ORF type:complete len:234 (+),score=53.01 GHRR01023043.1:164-865(+)